MTVPSATSAPRPNPTTSTNPTQAPAAATATGSFANAEELQTYLAGDEVQQIRATLAGSSELADSSWVKGFDQGVNERIAQLGPNPSKEDVKKAVNAEFFEQRVSKMAVDRANSRIMDRVKSMMQDTFG